MGSPRKFREYFLLKNEFKLVWKETTELGIGIVTSPKYTFVCGRYRKPGNLPSAVPKMVGRLLPKSEWGNGKPVGSNTPETAPATDKETSDESNPAGESTRQTSVSINHGFVVDSITVNGTRFGSSQGGNRVSFELDADEEILYVAAKRVRNDFKYIVHEGIFFVH